MIYLTKDTGAFELDAGTSAVCVTHESYGAPRIDCPHLPLSEFMADVSGSLHGRGTLVVVGLNKILTPGNRTTLGKVFLRPMPGIKRISIDRTLFVSEPWRAWFHFGCTSAKYREYTYSYLAESHWRAALEGIREDPFSLGMVAEEGAGQVVTDHGQYFQPMEIERVEVGPSAHKEYQTLKAQCFNEEHTVHGIIKRLASFAKEVCPRRKLPTRASLFSRREHEIIITDLMVDTYLIGELTGLVDLTNGIARSFYGG